ncbi:MULTISPECIES: TOMM precursor leader peptide-binding protein [unclassified Arthrobacter]|uniref:TOMM precursor leader peptide-binding protein n=1 Tax=unclassified Arthrobacter TaxID=235627 RepID=UPI00159D9764|nr:MULTISPECIES: TOMM precursor leader peptide-binding protein [unclassified Arthrobacter]MCQ9163115.1 TOMM precursor leader peptide-binding protein [Arthrobacter sp. STN4]NVM97564.1 TOMM precursor leader peptide-binding protein [Arthrobacter sp. SDTb3-6]
MTIINPGLRMVARGPGSIQIGVGPGGTIIDGLQPADLLFIQELRRGIPDGQAMAAAKACALEAARAAEICASLRGILVSDGELRMQGFRAERLRPEHSALLGLHHGQSRDYMDRREHGLVHVMGLGRTGAALALVLASAGVGTLLLEDDRTVTAADVSPGSFRLADIGLPRSAAVRRHLLSLDPRCHAHVLHTGGLGSPDMRCLDLAVVVAHDAVGSETAARFMSTDRPHLLVLVREQDGTVGPLVLPGETACAECVERHRGAGDPQWLQVREQLAAGSGPEAARPGQEPPPGLEDAALSTALAGTAAAQALLFLDAVNRPSTWSAVLTFHHDNGRWSREEFAVHPECSCQLQRQALETISNTASP